jgi:kojibiose phosphorylase
LGPPIQSILAARLGDIKAAYWNFMHAARTDLQDARRNTDEGIHAATAGGLWQAAVFGFGGLQLTPTGPTATPHFPAEWKRLAFKIQYHGERYNFDLHLNPPNADLSGSTSTPALAEEIAAYSPSFPILGAIFDLDGVLTDTSELHYQAWKRLADEEGFPFSREDNEALRGVPRRDSLLLLLKGSPLPEERLHELMERKNRYYQEAIANLSPENLLPGARSLLEEIRAGGVKIAIGSASQNARPVIEKLGILPFIDAISDGYSVQRQKPAPDLFLHAASQLDLLPGQCIVFEDAEEGIAAALAGGMWAVGIGPKARVGAAHLVLPGLEGRSWESILAGLRQSAKHRHKDVLQDPFI